MRKKDREEELAEADKMMIKSKCPPASKKNPKEKSKSTSPPDWLLRKRNTHQRGQNQDHHHYHHHLKAVSKETNTDKKNNPIAKKENPKQPTNFLRNQTQKLKGEADRILTRGKWYERSKVGINYIRKREKKKGSVKEARTGKRCGENVRR